MKRHTIITNPNKTKSHGTQATNQKKARTIYQILMPKTWNWPFITTNNQITFKHATQTQ